MKKKWILIVIFSSFPYLFYALKIELGQKKPWGNVYLKNLNYVKDENGLSAISVKEYEYIFNKKNVDLLIHFNTKNNKWKQPLDNYILIKKNFSFDSNIKQLGTSSARFYDLTKGLKLKPKKSSFFKKKYHAGDFTIEFWIRPATLNDGEIILKRYGPVIKKGQVIGYSGLICSIENRRLQWKFQDVFKHPEQINKSYYFNDQEKKYVKKYNIKLQAKKRLKKNIWSHHALVYNSLSGQLIYYVNGNEETTTFVTESFNPEDTVLIPRFYPQEHSPLIIGENYIGYIDELMISKVAKIPYNKLIQKSNKTYLFLQLEKYVPTEGIAISSIYDLNQTGSYLKRFKINALQKSDSFFILQARMNNNFFTPDKSNEYLAWKTLNTKKYANLITKQLKGRYFQWRAIFKSSQNGRHSPILKKLNFDFFIDKNPKPPTGLIAFSQDNKIFLKWNSNIEADLKAYRIYYELEKNNYIVNQKPININVNQLSQPTKPIYHISNLLQNQLYYFTITAIDKNNHESLPSNKVFSRVEK